jgi:hypothetical protein
VAGLADLKHADHDDSLGVRSTRAQELNDRTYTLIALAVFEVALPDRFPDSQESI